LPFTQRRAPEKGESVELRSIDLQACISLTAWRVDDTLVKVAMAVQDGDFTGGNEPVYFFRDAFAAFIEALEHFSRDHAGEARLESVNPGEAMLSIRPIDAARHVLAEAQVARGHYLRDHYYWDCISVAFELDPSQLPDIVRSLAAVIASAELP
jgi:hypothetical protein